MKVTIQRQGRVEKGASEFPAGAAIVIGIVIGTVGVILIVLVAHAMSG